MPITSIERYFVGDPNIVSIITTDNFATITTAGYIGSQNDEINAIINGSFQWAPTDIVLIYYSSDEIGFFKRDAETDTFVALTQTPITASAMTSTDDTNVKLTLNGTPATSLLQPVELAFSWSGLLSASRGGTGVNNGASNTLTFAGDVTFAGAFDFTGNLSANTNVTFPTSGTLATTSQIPSGQALTRVSDTNVTIDLGGTPTTALLQPVSLTMGWTGVLAPSRGGTGKNNGINTLQLDGNFSTVGPYATLFL